MKNVNFLLFFGLVSATLLAIIYKSYWTLERKINCDFLQPFTPNFFEFSKTNKFKTDVYKGACIAKKSSIVVCGLIRDKEEKVKDIRERVNILRKYFLKVKILIVENDSKDDTRKNLLCWAREDKDVEVLGCGINNINLRCSMKLPKTEGHYVTSERVKKMAKLRNIYRDRIEEVYSDYEYILVWDMDVLGSLYIDGILSSLAKLSETIENVKPDAMCSNGLYIWPGISLYYDTFAHTDPDILWSKVFGEKVEHIIKTFYAQHTPKGVKKVTSCFSGATIYKTQSFLKNRYSIKDKECEHDSISKNLNMFVNGNMINYILLNS